MGLGQVQVRGHARLTGHDDRVLVRKRQRAAKKYCTSPCAAGTCCADGDWPGQVLPERGLCAVLSLESGCVAGQCCDAGTRQCSGSTCACSNDAQCGAGKKCCYARCATACADAECGAGKCCQDGACEPCCKSDADCVASQCCNLDQAVRAGLPVRRRCGVPGRAMLQRRDRHVLRVLQEQRGLQRWQGVLHGLTRQRCPSPPSRRP
jgi:hypothetical protein